MKTIKKILVALAFASLSLIGVACSSDEKKLSQRVENFEVAEQDTVEIGQYYTPDIPEATLDGKKAVVSLVAEQNGKELIFNGNNALLVESFEDVTLIYTIAEGEVKIEKKTVLKVQDTTAPYIITNALPAKIYRGVTFGYADYIRIGDLSGTILESSITVTDQDGGSIATEDGALTLSENSDVKEVVFSVAAKDGKNNLAEKTIAIPVLDAALWNTPLNFTALDLSSITASTSGTSVEAVEKGGESALKITHTAAWSGKNNESKTIFKFTENVANYTCFDYIKIVVSAKANCNIDIPRAIREGQTEHIKIKASAEESEKIELFYDMDLVGDSDKYVVSGNNFQMDVRLLEAQYKEETKPENVEMELYLYSFEFGYYEREVADDKPIDTTQFGIEADEVISVSFTPDGGEAQTVELSRWTPKKGTLTFTIKKDAYRETTVEVSIDPVPQLIDESTDNDTDIEFKW